MYIPQISAAIPLRIKIYDQKTYSGKVNFLLDNNVSASFELSGKDAWIELPEINYMPGQAIAVEGYFKPEKSIFTLSRKGRSDFKVLDFAEFMSLLNKGSDSVKKRWSDYITLKEEFEKKYTHELDESKVYVMNGDKNSESEISEAEKRIGYKLPDGFREFLALFGAVMINDHSFSSAKSINNSYVQMEKEWGTPSSVMQQYPEETKRFLKSTVILYTLSGDGYGAVIFKPESDKKLAAGYYFLHQETISDPEIISAGYDFNPVLSWIVLSASLETYESSLNENVVFIDSSSPGPANLILEPDYYNKEFEFRLRIDADRL